MPQNYKILNKKEIKEILKQIEEQWGADLDLEYGFIQNNKTKISIINRDIGSIDLEKLRINSIGMYFCELERGIRLSIEGSQLVGPKATKNVLEVSKEDAKLWLLGEDLPSDGEFEGFVIIKSEDDYFGSGKSSKGKILNYVGKERRISAL